MVDKNDFFTLKAVQPVSFELPECSEKTLRFNCKSKHTGRFSVVGYVIILYGLTYKIYFSELKKFQREFKIKQSHQVEVETKGQSPEFYNLWDHKLL